MFSDVSTELLTRTKSILTMQTRQHFGRSSLYIYRRSCGAQCIIMLADLVFHSLAERAGFTTKPPRLTMDRSLGRVSCMTREPPGSTGKCVHASTTGTIIDGAWPVIQSRSAVASISAGSSHQMRQPRPHE